MPHPTLLTAVLTAALVFPPLQSQDGPSPEEVEKARVELDRALDAKEVEAQVAALTAYGRTPAAAVVDQVERGLAHKEREVKSSAIEALRFNAHPDALKALHKVLKKDKRLRKDAELYAALVRAVCQHGSASSLSLLGKNPLDKLDRQVGRARILGYGMIRERESVAELMKLLQSLGLRERQNYLSDFRIALYVLSGVDKGTNVEAWQAWWNDNKKTLKVAEEAPKLPEVEQLRWNRYWGLDLEYQRDTKRRERGDDPER